MLHQFGILKKVSGGNNKRAKMKNFPFFSVNPYTFLRRGPSVQLMLVFIPLLLLTVSAIVTDNLKKDKRTNNLPNVFNEKHGDLVESKLRHEAILQFPLYQLPDTKKVWDTYKIRLKNELIQKTGVLVNQRIPLLLKETGAEQMKGYSIKNISFQTRPGVYATANLYIPDGSGKFPGVIVMMGHSANGRFDDNYQCVGITLALNGYVGLCIDPWGAGERTTVHGVFEDHGDENNLGAALMDVGETLMGLQITDNIRGVDLLCSLPYVDHNNIGATGSSGGGNQTMWLTAIDERIKAAVPVVSVGTFESYVMGSPCICEVLVDGLTITEEAAVLALVAPRAIKMCNHNQDANEAFNPREMKRSYANAKPIFSMLGVEDNIAYDTFNLAHGYWPQDREEMLGWFNLHLKKVGNGAQVKEISYNTLPYEQLMVYAKGRRDAEVISTAVFCKQRGNELKASLANTKFLNAEAKRNELRKILRADEKSVLKKVHEYVSVNGWKRFALETSDNKLIPLNNVKEFTIVSNVNGKENISPELIDGLIKSGVGIAVVDLSATGETADAALYSTAAVGRLRTLSKSYLWLGKTVLGEWVKELDVVTRLIKVRYKLATISINGSKEAGLAGLYLAALQGDIDQVTLLDAPVSYVFDSRDGVEFFSTGIHVPGFLNWGDVSLAAALTGKNVTFKNPVSMSGSNINGDALQAYKAAFERIRRMTNQKGKTYFN
jgi:hypothetical protein